MTDLPVPQNEDAETALLGCCMQSVGAIRSALEQHVSAADFYTPRHAAIWQAIIAAHEAGEQPHDLVTLAGRLNGQLGPTPRAELARIEANTPATANANAYARIVRARGRERQLLNAASELRRRIFEGDPTDAILEEIGDLTAQADTEDNDTWEPVDLTAALDGTITRPEASILLRDDHQGLFYAGRVNGIHGDSGLGKSMLTAYAAAQQLDAGHHVGWVDFEEPDETVIVERLRMLGIADTTITDQFHYYRPQDPFTQNAVRTITAAAIDQTWVLLVIDSLGEAFGLESIDENKDVEVGPWMRRVPRTLADAGPAVITIDHATKAADNPLHPSGSKRKRAAITGASYLIEAPTPLTRDHGGQLRITCAKDRHGNYQRGKEVATLNFDIAHNTATVTCRAPGTSDNWTGPTHCIEASIDLLESVSPDELSTTQIVKALAERGKSYRKQTIISALGIAVESGHLSARSGPRGAVMYRSAESDKQEEIF